MVQVPHRSQQRQMADEQQQDKIEAEKRRVAGVYGRAAATFDRVGPRFFGYFGQRLVEQAALQPGERVLDVACGRGAALLPASDAVGEHGLAIGIDLSEGMIRALADEGRVRARRNLGVCVMDAECLEFPDDSFDCVLCGFALFFFPRLEQALSEMRRVLKPGGRIAVSTWDKADDAGWEWYGELLKSYLPTEAFLQESNERGHVFDERQGIESILRTAGFRDVQASVERFESAYRDEEEWWRVAWSHGSRRRLEEIEAQGGAEALERFKRDAFRWLQRMMTPEGLRSTFVAILAVGRK